MVGDILAERGKRYGTFAGHAKLAQRLKNTMGTHCRENGGTTVPAWQGLAPDQREALEMIAHKVARILNGDPDYPDSWRDIEGYSKLVADRLETEQGGRSGALAGIEQFAYEAEMRAKLRDKSGQVLLEATGDE